MRLPSRGRGELGTRLVYNNFRGILHALYADTSEGSMDEINSLILLCVWYYISTNYYNNNILFPIYKEDIFTLYGVVMTGTV